MDEHAAESSAGCLALGLLESLKAGMEGPSSILVQTAGPSLSEVSVFVNLITQVPLVAFVLLLGRSK